MKEDYRYIGKVSPRRDARDIVTGKTTFLTDRKMLDMLYGKVLRSPHAHAIIKKVDKSKALALKGVKAVITWEGERDIGYTIRVGNRFPFTYGSHGKAIAAFLPREELDQLLRGKHLYFHGKPDGFNRQRLMKELAQVRRDWFALDLGDMRPGLNSASSPVLGPGTTPIGYIIIIGLISEEAARQFGLMVAEAARMLSAQLGADVDALWEKP
jgi:hypothetical protein